MGRRKSSTSSNTSSASANNTFNANNNKDNHHVISKRDQFRKYRGYKERPQWSYSSLSDYYKEMCFHLRLEQQLEFGDPIREFSSSFKVSGRSVTFQLTVPFSKQLEEAMEPKFVKMGKLPFQQGQAVFLINKDDVSDVWACEVLAAERDEVDKKIIHVELSMFEWNDFARFKNGVPKFTIVPGGPGISRTLVAMRNILESRSLKGEVYKDMILGKHINQTFHPPQSGSSLSKSAVNPSQKAAIQHALNNPVTVIQGPPGTGKTSTIKQMVLEFINTLQTPKIVIVAQSNVAIDNVAEKLMESNISVLRITSAAKEPEYKEDHPLAKICLHILIYNQLSPEYKNLYDTFFINNTSIGENDHSNLLAKMFEIGEPMVKKATVLCTTSVSSGGKWFTSLTTLVVIMDESTQSNEATTLIPLGLRGIEHFVFVGDERQLSAFSDIEYLEQSLFERVLKNGSFDFPLMLDTQYRMHPAISAFPRTEIYHGKLLDGVTSKERDHPLIHPLTFIDTLGKLPDSQSSNMERNGQDGYSFINRGEAKVIVQCVKILLDSGGAQTHEIGIIAPYAAQRDVIANLIQDDNKLNPDRENIKEETDQIGVVKRPPTMKTIVGIMIATVDAFQGREKEFMLFSCVRSNKFNKIGFVSDKRRMNVALTRAKNVLVVVGDSYCLQRGNLIWRRYMDHLEEERVAVSIDEGLDGYIDKESLIR